MDNKYKDGITVLTLTGDRHIVFRRCRDYVARQTILPDQWVVVDDGESPTPVELNEKTEVTYIRRRPSSDKRASFLSNLIEGIGAISYKKIIVMEDDDWYHPTWIERCVRRLKGCQLAGESHTIYYNWKYREYFINPNSEHSSLCQTVFSCELLDFIHHIVFDKETTFVDMHLWSIARNLNIPSKLYNERFCIGMKGLPGRVGLGAGHRYHGKKYDPDPNFSVLKKFIGEKDASYYIELKE